MEHKKQQVIKEVLSKSKGVKLAYDYDGTYIIAKTNNDFGSKLRKPAVQQFSYLIRISQVESVFKQDTPLEIHKAIDPKPKSQNAQSQRSNKPQKTAQTLQDTKLNEGTTKPFQSFIPNQGVKLIYQSNAQEIVEEAKPQKWDRMTRKEFQELQQVEQRKQNQFKSAEYITQIASQQSVHQLQSQKDSLESIKMAKPNQILNQNAPVSLKGNKVIVQNQELMNQLFS